MFSICCIQIYVSIYVFYNNTVDVLCIEIYINKKKIQTNEIYFLYNRVYIQYINKCFTLNTDTIYSTMNRQTID